MKAILLSAGQGKRLFPFTKNRPKCMIEIEGSTVIEYQINALKRAGIKEVVVVLGFKSKMVEEHLRNIYKDSDINIKCYYNPFYCVSDNLASCWIVRDEFNDDFLIVNGDDIFEVGLVKKLLKSKKSPVTVAINIKESYDADDMKVKYDSDGNLVEIGKHLDLYEAEGEAIGIHLFRGKGVTLYKEKVEEIMSEIEGLSKWYPFAIDCLAKEGYVTVCDISEFKWAEVDFPQDIEHARKVIKYIMVQDDSEIKIKD